MFYYGKEDPRGSKLRRGEAYYLVPITTFLTLISYCISTCEQKLTSWQCEQVQLVKGQDGGVMQGIILQP